MPRWLQLLQSAEHCHSTSSQQRIIIAALKQLHCQSWLRPGSRITHLSWPLTKPGLDSESDRIGSGACFLKVPKLFGPISGATIPFTSSQRQGSKPSNFAILLVFLILKTCKKISFSKQADCSLTTSFSGPKSSRDFRETGSWVWSGIRSWFC